MPDRPRSSGHQPRNRSVRPRHADRATTRRSPSTEAPRHPPVHLENDILAELRATVRPGKAEILIKVFSEAAGAFAADDYDEALRLGEQAKHMALRSIVIRELLGIAYYRSERWSEAARELSAFRRIAGSTEQNPVLADTYRALGKPERAVELCDEIAKDRVSDEVYFEGAIVAAGALGDLGRVDEAIERLEALELEPESTGAHHVRA